MNEQYVISESLKDLGLNILANDAIKQENQYILGRYVSILEKISTDLKRHDIIERLWSVGLIYG